MLRSNAQAGKISGIVYLALLSAACGSPLAPSPSPQAVTVTLTIEARDAVSRAPLSAVRAYASNLRSCTTKDDGRCWIDVANGAEVTVALWGDGYADALRTATVSGDTRWTFYLGGE